MTSEKFQHLSDFVQNRMQMSHIYQPVMLIELLRNGGAASVDEIAKSLLEYDVSQVEYYERITKNMVGKVLTSKGNLVEKVKTGGRVGGYRIPDANTLTAEEVENLISLCMTRIDQFIEKRGDGIWSHRRKSAGYISGTIRYEVLKRAKFRCELCGISANEKALEVDHIVPRSRGGRDDITNFQALCYSCNAMKRDRDDTDFRNIANTYSDRKEECLFCDLQSGDKGRILIENELCYAIFDGYPVTSLHTLIISKRHVPSYFELYQPELNAIYALLNEMKTNIETEDDSVTGFNIGINGGEDAGQTIFHCHVHLIPRRKGDIEDPRGGVRGVIPAKQSY